MHNRTAKNNWKLTSTQTTIKYKPHGAFSVPTRVLQNGKESFTIKFYCYRLITRDQIIKNKCVAEIIDKAGIPTRLNQSLDLQFKRKFLVNQTRMKLTYLFREEIFFDSFLKIVGSHLQTQKKIPTENLADKIEELRGFININNPATTINIYSLFQERKLIKTVGVSVSDEDMALSAFGSPRASFD
jgi:hypothetical protein